MRTGDCPRCHDMGVPLATGQKICRDCHSVAVLEYWKTHLCQRVMNSARARLRVAFLRQGVQPPSGLASHLGCSAEELVSHLEGQFGPDDSWDTWGSPEGWCMDHVYPLSRLDLASEEELRFGANFSNIRVYPTRLNRLKSDSLWDYIVGRMLERQP